MEKKDKKKKCIWCFGECTNKYYCTDCATKCQKECCRCHKPYPDLKYFTKNDKRCDSCEGKNINEKMKRSESKNRNSKIIQYCKDKINEHQKNLSYYQELIQAIDLANRKLLDLENHTTKAQQTKKKEKRKSAADSKYKILQGIV